MTPHRESVWEVTKVVLGKLKNLGKILDIIRRCFGLTVEDSGNGYFISSKLVGDVFESEIFDRFSLEDLGGMEATKGALVTKGELSWRFTYEEFTHIENGGMGSHCTNSLDLDQSFWGLDTEGFQCTND